MNIIIVVIFLLIVSIGLLVLILNPFSNNNTINNSSPQNQSKMGNWKEIHGIGIFPKEKDQGGSLFLATHNGLFKKDKDNSSDWKKIGNQNLDLRGFVINPVKGVMYASGHPYKSGNIGFRISSDYGQTWSRASDTFTNSEQIDFHALAMGNKPEIIYGTTEMGYTIYISLDEGKTWSTVNFPNEAKIISLAVNKTDSNNIYVSTTDGLFSSINRGKNWQKIVDKTIDVDSHDTIVTGLEISSDGKTAYAFVTPGRGEDIHGYIVKSVDGAKTWIKTIGQIDEADFIVGFEFGNNDEIYAIVNQNNAKFGMASSVYKSIDQGNNWTLEGTNNNQLLAEI